jgi:hypothetical protein
MTWTLGFYAVLAFCAGILAVGCFAARARLRTISLRDVCVLLSPFLFPPFILLWGFNFSWWGPRDTEPLWRLEATRWLFYVLYPGLSAFSIWRSRGLRPVAAALVPLSFVISALAAGLAVAFVTGD